MASAQDRWLFLLAFAPIPLACADDVPQDPTDGSSSSSTTGAPPPNTTGTTDAEGSTTIVTATGVDGTSSSSDDGTTVEGSSSTEAMSSSSSDGTTMSIEPGTSSSSGEGSSSTGEPLGLCELWAETLSMCYGYYYPPAYLIGYCYDYLTNVDVLCAPTAAQYYQCWASGCFVDCSTEYDELQECNELVLEMQLGCDMIPVVPSAGTIGTQCAALVDQAEICTAGGFYIPGFSGYIMYAPGYTEYFCTNGAYFTYLFPPPAVGDACGGAYEELLTCLTGLSCAELENAAFPGSAYCTAQQDALTCRCELGA